MPGLKSLKAFFLDNLSLKLISLALALILWLVVMGEQKSDLIYNAPLEFKNLSSDLMVSNDPFNEPIQVVLRGSRTDLLSLSPKQIKLTVDLKEAKEGERYYYLRPDNIETPRGIEVVSVTPTRIKLTLEAIGEKMVEVAPQIKGKPAKGYEILRINAEPDSVKVTGPKNLVNGLRRIDTIAVQVGGARRDVVQEVGFDLGDKKIKVKDYKQVVVTVTIVPKEGAAAK